MLLGLSTKIICIILGGPATVEVDVETKEMNHLVQNINMPLHEHIKQESTVCMHKFNVVQLFTLFLCP